MQTTFVFKALVEMQTTDIFYNGLRISWKCTITVTQHWAGKHNWEIVFMIDPNTFLYNFWFIGSKFWGCDEDNVSLMSNYEVREKIWTTKNIRVSLCLGTQVS